MAGAEVLSPNNCLVDFTGMVRATVYPCLATAGNGKLGLREEW
ncbi:hypothetical protein LEP1GSC195_2314 [Leptospira wolbachii serovar Codice str. CDC]|uniref:Uncharacterized protein n=1 Tax=Leptospira wolbachii serovar Codice str. CDC TaxID=1218599 RepID=R9A626_9LEPT|nr:hypothetical protein LEP1GSC195_2314 [Leptospira wolbachii serovar Codice str. CDC]